MNKHILTAVLFVSVAGCACAQSLDNDLVSLRKAWFAEPAESRELLKSVTHPELKASKEFIEESAKKKNKITSPKYVSRPDSITLKHLYAIRWMYINSKENDTNRMLAVLDSINRSPASTYEQLANYYEMIYISVSNHNNPLDMSKVNFNIDDYGFKDDTEKGIFFLESMRALGTFIWGYMNIPKPPRFDKALDEIKNYPTFNGKPYYEYQDLNFKDFLTITDKRNPPESFKKYYINKYMETLFYHAVSLAQNKKRDESMEVLTKSILKDESYYEYSSTPEIFREIFRKLGKR